MNLNHRVAEIIEYSKLSPSEFADAIDVQRSSISHITSGRNKPSLDFLIKIKEYFPELEWEWIITGQGTMLKNESVTDKNNEKAKPTSLPDLFAMIDDDRFGYTESEDRTQKSDHIHNNETASESPKTTIEQDHEFLSDSQRLEKMDEINPFKNTEIQENRIKRVVLFFENGKFESYET